jgi:ferric-dicitrate binding protein FerR (iron transport regulator)
MAWLLFAVLTTGILYFALSRNHTAPTNATDTNVEQYADLGSRRSLLLPDGTHVWLNAGSRIHYDSDMLQKDARIITLSGEAFFDVARDKDRPFIIHTSKIAIRVLGTAFNVKAYPQDRVTETTLMGGSIELTINSKPYQKIILKPKEKFALIDETRDSLRTQPVRPATAVRSNPEKLVVQDVVPVEVEDKEYVKEVAWIDDNFVFQNETLEELAPKMERWFNVHIHVDNARVGNLHYSGIFHKETIDQALTALQLIRPFNFKITDNHVFIH